MALVMTAAPAAEPISLAEAKAHLRVDGTEEDALLGALITAARLTIERTLGLALVTQGWSYFLDRWRRRGVTLPILPVQVVSAVTVHDEDGGATVLDVGAYAVDVLSKPARLVARVPHPRGDRCGRAQALAHLPMRGAGFMTVVSVRGS